MEKKENHARIIFHIDMNQFFCSVACILNPKLRGKAFAIGRENTKKGVLSTASYEARKYGISSAMPTIDALKILPSLIVIHVDYSHYVEYHHKFINLISEYTKQIEVASIDECFIDVTELSKVRHPLVIAKEIQKRLLTEYDLPCSIGIAPTLYLAKMASDIKKPLGVTVIRKRDIENILYDLPVKDIFGIGKKTYPRLMENGINTIRDFMNLDNKEKVLSLIGENSYNYAYQSLKGNSSNVVNPNRYAVSKSISESTTFDYHLSDIDELSYEFRKMTRSVYNKMKRENYYTKCVTITLRDSDFNTITRQESYNEYTDDFYKILGSVLSLLDENYVEKRYRLIGVGVSSLLKEDELPKEYNLFTVMNEDEKKIRIEDMMDEFKNKYGKKALFWNKDNK